jgi:hypothetical protein
MYLRARLCLLQGRLYHASTSARAEKSLNGNKIVGREQETREIPKGSAKEKGEMTLTQKLVHSASGQAELRATCTGTAAIKTTSQMPKKRSRVAKGVETTAALNARVTAEVEYVAKCLICYCETVHASGVSPDIAYEMLQAHRVQFQSVSKLRKMISESLPTFGTTEMYVAYLRLVATKRDAEMCAKIIKFIEADDVRINEQVRTGTANAMLI